MSDAVRDVLLRRLDALSVPGHRDDAHRVVLAVEGGGMRGAVASGMLLALEQLGFRDSFDAVVGTSAGAISGAFFATGQGTKGSILYYSVLNSERFVDRKRLFSSGPVLDLDYLLGEAFDEQEFDWDQLMSGDLPLYATLTPATPPVDAGSAMTGFESNFEYRHVTGGVERARSILAASAALPVLGGGSRLVDGVEYVDGGMTEPVPWRAALSLGATHVLVVRSRGYNEDGEPEQFNLLERSTVPRLVKRMHGDYVSKLVRDHAELFVDHTESLKAVSDELASPWPRSSVEAPMFDTVIPSAESAVPDRLEVDTHVLMDALAGGAKAMVEYLNLDGFEVEQRVVINHPRAPLGATRSSVLTPIVRSRRQFRRS